MDAVDTVAFCYSTSQQMCWSCHRVADGMGDGLASTGIMNGLLPAASHCRTPMANSTISHTIPYSLQALRDNVVGNSMKWFMAGLAYELLTTKRLRSMMAINAPIAMPIRLYSTVKMTWTQHTTGIVRP